MSNSTKAAPANAAAIVHAAEVRPRDPGPPSRPPAGAAREQLDLMIDWARVLAYRAVTHAWASGRIVMPEQDRRPFEHEVHALAGQPILYDAGELTAIDDRLAALTAQVEDLARTYRDTTYTLPMNALVRHFGLGSDAISVLLMAAAPQLSGEVRRLYEILAGGSGRALVDRHLLHRLAEGLSDDPRGLIDAQLRPPAPLRHHRVIVVHEPRDQVAVQPLLLDRLRGFDATEWTSPHARVCGPPDTLPDLHDFHIMTAAALRHPEPDSPPLRLVLRGEVGSGRLAMLAWMADRAGRPLHAIDMGQLDQVGRHAVRRLLQAVHVAGGTPCFTNFERLPIDDRAAEQTRAILEQVDAHPGPVTFCAPPSMTFPRRSGWHDVLLRPLARALGQASQAAAKPVQR